MNDRPGEGEALNYLGYAYQAAGDLQQALRLHRQAVAILGETEARQPLCRALVDLGETYFSLRETEPAEQAWGKALALAREIGDRYAEATRCLKLALLHNQQGNGMQALPLAHEAARLFAEIGHAAYAQRARELVAQLEG